MNGVFNCNEEIRTPQLLSTTIISCLNFLKLKKNLIEKIIFNDKINFLNHNFLLHGKILEKKILQDSFRTRI